MFIQFSDGVLQLKFVSGKQENGSKFANTSKILSKIRFGQVFFSLN
jgi:hypothetical protein